jgi:transposase-like protein
MNKEKPKRKRSCRRVPEDVKLRIAKDRHIEGKSSMEIAGEYGLGITTVNGILSNFAAENDKSALFMKKDATAGESEEIKALKREVMELKRQLYDETMRADFYDTMIEVAEEMFGIEIRKKAGTGQSKGCTRTK